MKPTVDEILQLAVENGLPPEMYLTGTQGRRVVAEIHRALSRSGFAIVLDEAQLLGKGGEVKLHD